MLCKGQPGAREDHGQPAPDEATSDEDEDGVPKVPLGAGVWGAGRPMQVALAGKIKDFDDGAGLCSPGR